MILRIAFYFLTMLITTRTMGQGHTFTGKITDDHFAPIYKAKIFNADTVLLAESDQNGYFSIASTTDTITLLIASVAMEWKNIQSTSGCNSLDIILQNGGTYDFMSAGKVDRLRKKAFKKLPALHHAAFEKGIFSTDKPCYTDTFISIRKRLKYIHKNRT